MTKDTVRTTMTRFALAGVALGLAASPAFAQAPAPAAAPAKQAAAPAAPAGPAPEWIKVCGKDEASKTELCSVASYILDGQGNVRGQIRILDVTRDKEKKRIIEAMIPPGFKQTYEPLHRELALADENYLSKQRHLAHVTDLDQRAAEQLQFRRTELQDALTELKTADEERGG